MKTGLDPTKTVRFWCPEHGPSRMWSCGQCEAQDAKKPRKQRLNEEREAIDKEEMEEELRRLSESRRRTDL